MVNHTIHPVISEHVTDIAQNFKDIPVGGLTHLHFAFGYITPGDFNVAPMDGLQSSLFSDLTDLKQKNNGLKTIVALGGWTFTDSGTATQPVFSNIVSSASNRAKFITNLLSFLREYAFDGVDFDWVNTSLEQSYPHNAEDI